VLKELDILSPLASAGLYKNEIRHLSRELNLATWCKPSVHCLATRFDCGETITKHKLNLVAQAEQVLSELGFSQYRVRIHDSAAMIELHPKDIERLTQGTLRIEVDIRLKEIGFSSVAVDLGGYHTQSRHAAAMMQAEA
jgi:uncharacterized protein